MTTEDARSHRVDSPLEGSGVVEQKSEAEVELAELKAKLANHAAAQRGKYTGWKAITVWYAFWALALGIGSIASLFSGQIGAFLVGAVVAALSGLYAKYLHGGGTRRVWFFIF